MPLRSTRAISGSRDRTRSARAAAIWEPGAPYRHVHRQHRAAPRHGRRTTGQGSDRDCAGGIHHAKQRRLDHVRQVLELTACGTGGQSKAWYRVRRSSEYRTAAVRVRAVGGRLCAESAGCCRRLDSVDLHEQLANGVSSPEVRATGRVWEDKWRKRFHLIRWLCWSTHH
jgi:hypothetical protein